MSTRFDIIDAREALKRHLETHKCGELTACAVRADLRRTHMNTAARWAIEPGDDARQREQFSQRVATGSTT